MQKLITTIIIGVFLLGSNSFYAQMGRFNEHNTGVGLDRNIGGSVRSNTPRKSEPVDFVKITVDAMSKNLTLDGFQSAILKNIVEEYQRVTALIVEEDIPNAAKYEKIKIERDKMDAKTVEILNEKQKKAFEELKKSGSEVKKNKKKKKRNDSDVDENKEL